MDNTSQDQRGHELAGSFPLALAGRERRRTLAPLVAFIVFLVFIELAVRFGLDQPADFGHRGVIGLELERRIYELRRGPGQRVLFVGDSRVTIAVNPTVFEQACADRGVDVIAANLAAEGEWLYSSIRRVVDERIEADVVVIGSSLRLAPRGSGGLLGRVTPADMADFLISIPIRNHMRGFRGRATGAALLRWVRSGFTNAPPPARWSLYGIGENVSIFSDPAQREQRQAWEFQLYQYLAVGIPGRDLNAHAERLARLIHTLHDRGATVAIIRMPTAGRLHAFEDSVFDVDEFTDSLAARCPLIVLPADGLQHKFDGRQPDLSHLDDAAADEFTRILAEMLIERGIVHR